MLLIDNGMLKLAKMQKTLLEKTTGDRRPNLEKYKTTVIDIDKKAFSSLLDELKDFSEHNHPLDDELVLLEQIKSYYGQLYELQCSFRSVCELYGDNEIELSDLTLIDYEYINGRINTINGYLINKKNIDINKNKLEELNKKLVILENDKKVLEQKLLDYEKNLRNSFLSAEGRMIQNGQLQYISVISEYEKLGYDFERLLNNSDEVTNLLDVVLVERNAALEKLQAAELCYKNIPNIESRQILNDIRIDYLKVSYRECMLKILYLLALDYYDCELFMKKREDLFDLIQYRISYLRELNVTFSYDPFVNTKLSEQIKLMSTLTDNSKNIAKIKKDIAELCERVEQMKKQNIDYMVTINDVRDLLISKTSMSDIDVSLVNADIENCIKVEKAPLDNQVVEVKEFLPVFNIDRVRQKTGSVIRRVNEMMTSIPAVDTKVEEVVSPELVIVPKSLLNEKSDEVNLSSGDLFDNTNDTLVVGHEEVDDKKSEEDFNGSVVLEEVYNSDIFKTVDPFVESPLFSDRADDSFDKSGVTESLSSVELENISHSDDAHLVLEYTEEMPDAFWVTQGEEHEDIGDDNLVLSFDEQISALISEKNDNKIKKLAA